MALNIVSKNLEIHPSSFNFKTSQMNSSVMGHWDNYTYKVSWRCPWCTIMTFLSKVWRPVRPLKLLLNSSLSKWYLLTRITKSHKRSKYIFLSLCLFLSVCFLEVKKIFSNFSCRFLNRNYFFQVAWLSNWSNGNKLWSGVHTAHFSIPISTCKHPGKSIMSNSIWEF